MKQGKPRSIRQGRNLPEVRADNLSVVLEALQKLQPISRSGLADATGLTAATITHMVDELGSLDLLIETPSSERQVGRRPTLLTFNHDRGQVIGVEVSRSQVRAIRSDFSGRILARVERPFQPTSSVRKGLSLLQEVIGDVIDGRLPLLGIGVGVPGPVNSDKGIVLGPPNFGGWRNVELTAYLSEQFGVPCWLDDDAKAAAFGERWYGAGRSEETLLYISLRSGVGAGLIVGDRVYRGAHELAGEIGHTTIHVDGPICECGNRGCLETLVSVPAIMQEARRLGLSAENPADLQRLSAEGDLRALNIKDRVFTYLSAALVNAVNHYDPALIVLGGQLVRSWPELTTELAERVKGRSFGYLSKDVRIVESLLGEDATTLGAVAIAIHHILRDPRAVLTGVAAPGPASAVLAPAAP
ncbi:ROK family protein [Deinococcus peraridilitoris]|uniref:Transcriptional regulator/sugar kinase n=1 Tax=Deinococcus peraridilitoris (strain DSM 19664 / LMG 22246 / CIP 109416 / KR-200) TaxID=937777 RepID=K9ZXN0_DEIPD|nr:ROK family protein [Deinococcus peraridilitoris]AFZ65652.1 transcriptional regulator/sugar kinase [Deinococcus peraridilitoris DSM 19664]